MESIYPKLALCGRKNLCARTDTVFYPISEVSEGTVFLIKQCKTVELPSASFVSCSSLRLEELLDVFKALSIPKLDGVTWLITD